MSDAEYLIEQVEQELNAAISAFDAGVRKVHLELTNAYYSRVRQVKGAEPSDGRATKPFNCYREVGAAASGSEALKAAPGLH